MIAFDNGPANGDYVRYIDDLMKSAAIAASAGVLTSNDTGSGTLGRTRDRLAARRGTSGEWMPAAGTVEHQARQDAVQTGFVPQVAPTARATAAAAIASALMSGQMGGRGALATHTKVGLVAIAFGIVLVLVGFFWAPLNIILMAGGAALIAWAVRMMRDASARLTSTRV